VTDAGDPLSPTEVAEAIAELAGDLATQSPTLTMGEITEQGDSATAEFTVEWPLPGGVTWDYPSAVQLTKDQDGWRVVWEPRVVHPELSAGDQLRLQRRPAHRGEILAADGQPLLSARPVTVVGIWPSRVEDLDRLVTELTGALSSLGHELDLSDLPDRVADATEADLFVEVVTLRQEEYDRIADRIGDLPGITTRPTERQLAPTRTFARALLGTVGDVTAEVMERHPGVYEVGDQVGYGGLSEAYDQHLRGTPGYTVTIARPTSDGQVDDIALAQIDPVAGTALHITVDRQIQQTAETALAVESRPAALVAIRISDGAMVAVANTQGEEAYPVNTALTGAVPPGSTFKMVSAYQLLAEGVVTLDTLVECPAQVTVDGFTIRNAFPGDQGKIPFRDAVAISCNTAFALLSAELDDDGLAQAGAALGLGEDWDPGLATFTGAVPTGGSALEQAVTAFGQGETQVSPAAMAAAVAAVARGAWLPPVLVTEPAPPAVEPVPLPEPVVADLHDALRRVVTHGTASALAHVPGEPVYGKTGTAEAGPEVTHAWFIGWQGDLAVAVFVEDGRSGSQAAVPLAERFFRALAG